MTSFYPSRQVQATLPSYSSPSTLPVSASIGDVASVLSDNSLWQYTASGWVMVASGQMLSASGTGVLSGGNCTIDIGGLSYSISDGYGVVIDYSLTPHQHKIVYWSGLSAIPVNNTRPNTYIAIDKLGALYESGTELNATDERDYIYLAGYTQIAGTILAIKSAPVISLAPSNQINDILRAIGVFKVSGLNFAGIPATLTLSRSSGVLFDRSNNWKNSEKDPHEITIAAQSPLQFKRVTQTTINQTNFTTLDVTNYDLAGTVTAIAGSNNQATNMRLYQFGTGTVYVQYGQQIYSTLANAVAGVATENFNTNSVAASDNAVLVCTISVTKGATDLTNTTQAIFHLAGRFGDQGGGASGGVASVTLQQAYDNSISPEIQTNSTNGPFQLRRGSTAPAGDVLTIENQAGTRVSGITDTGTLTIGTGTGLLHSNASGLISSSLLVDADVSGSAAIAGTKISPNFGSQTVSTTGALSAFSVTGTSQVVSNGTTTSSFGYTCGVTYGLDTAAPGTLSVGGSQATAVNVGVNTSNNFINIGTGVGISSISVGSSNDTVLISGEFQVSDKLLTLNKGGAASSAAGAGFEIEENGSATGYIKVGGTRNSFQLKPPSAGMVEVVSSGADLTLTSTATVSRALSLPDTNGTLISSGDVGTVSSTMIIDGTIVNADINASAAIDGSKIVAASGSVAGVVTTASQTLAGNKTLSGVTTVSNTTASTSLTTGALIVTGGLGVGGDTWIGGNVYSSGTFYRIGQGLPSDQTTGLGMRSVAGTGVSNAAVERFQGTDGKLLIRNEGAGAFELARSGTVHIVMDGNGTAVRGRVANVGAGYVGETIKTTRGALPSLNLTANVYSIAVTYTLPSAGIWLISGQGFFQNTSGSSTAMTAALLWDGVENEESCISLIDVPASTVRAVALPARVISTTGLPVFNLIIRSGVNTTISNVYNAYNWISVSRFA